MADHRVNIFLTIKQKGMKVMKSAVAGLQKSIGGLFRLAKQATFALAGAFGVGAFFVKAAADAEEAESKFDAVFKELAQEARQWSEDTAKSVNRSAIELREFMSVLQDTFVPFGFARDKAADLSKEVVKLGVDLASFNNKAEADVIRDLQSALVGNVETVRKYGIALSETAIKLEAVRTGMSRTGKNLTELQKMQVRLSLIQKGSTDAMGDAERTANSFTNRIKGLVAAFKDFRIEVGAQIIQGAGLAKAVEMLTKKMRALFGSIRESKAVQNWAQNALSVIQKVSKGISDIMSGDARKKQVAIATFKDIGANFMQVVRDGLLKSAEVFGRLAGKGIKSAFIFGKKDIQEQFQAGKQVFAERQAQGGMASAILSAQKDFLSKFLLGVGGERQEAAVSAVRRAQLEEQGISLGAIGGTTRDLLTELVEEMGRNTEEVKGLKQPR